MKKTAAVFVFGLCLIATVPAHAGKISSVYTTYDITKCKRIAPPAEEFSGGFLCKGFKGNSIYWAEGDLRAGVGFGKSPDTHCSVQQSFGGFNSVDSKVEWRLDGGTPYAAIQRWRVSYDPENSEKIKTWLVVNHLEKAESCMAALIEGSLPDANEKARAAADGLSRTFSCKTDVAKITSVEPTTADQLISVSPCVGE
jgi:hypothetical protein